MMKTDKIKVSWRHREEIKEMYFQNKKPKEIAKKFGYNLRFLEKYLSGPATSVYKNTKRCSICRVRRDLTQFHILIGKNKRSACVICISTINKNAYIIRKNKGLESHSNITRGRHSWKYKVIRNTKRYINLIINTDKGLN